MTRRKKPMNKTISNEKLKHYMKDNFCFSSLKKNGIFPKEMKFNDYEGQAKIICTIFDLESIYEYSNIGRGEYCHISYANPTPFDRFVEPIGPPLMQVEGKTAKIVPFDNFIFPNDLDKIQPEQINGNLTLKFHE